MKITISPSQDQKNERHPFRTVEIWMPDDHMTLPQVVEELLAPALVAWGYADEAVREHLNLEP